MEYLNDSFSLEYGGEAYRDGWERTFSKVEECDCGNLMEYCGYVSGYEHYRCLKCGKGRYLNANE